MVFNKPPHSNLEVPIYLLKKLYVEFIKGLKVNYLKMKSNMGIGGRALQDRPKEK